jgi:hypothetical protein
LLEERGVYTAGTVKKLRFSRQFGGSHLMKKATRPGMLISSLYK